MTPDLGAEKPDEDYVFDCKACGITHDVRNLEATYDLVDTPLPDGRTLRTPKLSEGSREGFEHWRRTDELAALLSPVDSGAPEETKP